MDEWTTRSEHGVATVRARECESAPSFPAVKERKRLFAGGASPLCGFQAFPWHTATKTTGLVLLFQSSSGKPLGTGRVRSPSQKWGGKCVLSCRRAGKILREKRGKWTATEKGKKGIGTGEKGKGRRGRRGQQEAHARTRKTNKNESMGNGAWLISALSAAVTSMPQSRPGRTRIETLLLVDHFEWGNPFKQEGRPGALQSQSGSAFCRLLVLPLGGQPSPGQHPLRWFIHMAPRLRSRRYRPWWGSASRYRCRTPGPHPRPARGLATRRRNHTEMAPKSWSSSAWEGGHVFLPKHPRNEFICWNLKREGLRFRWVAQEAAPSKEGNQGVTVFDLRSFVLAFQPDGHPSPFRMCLTF